jgi:hypothetical protein
MTGMLAPMVPEGTDTAGAVARLASLPGLTTASGVAVDAAGASAAGKLLPVVPELETVLPLRGLRRGSTVSVTGSRSALFALLAAATTAGSWAAVVGMPDIGVAAAAELGVELRRLALVPRPGADLVRVAGALFDGVDIVVVSGGLRARAARQLAARARHRGGVLIADGRWPGADVQLSCTPGAWHGVDDTGRGRLTAREVTLCGRSRWSAQPVESTVLLPGPEGRAVAGVPGAVWSERRLHSVGRSESVVHSGWAYEVAG